MGELWPFSFFVSSSNICSFEWWKSSNQSMPLMQWTECWKWSTKTQLSRLEWTPSLEGLLFLWMVDCRHLPSSVRIVLIITGTTSMHMTGDKSAFDWLVNLSVKKVWNHKNYVSLISKGIVARHEHWEVVCFCHHCDQSSNARSKSQQATPDRLTQYIRLEHDIVPVPVEDKKPQLR